MTGRTLPRPSPSRATATPLASSHRAARSVWICLLDAGLSVSTLLSVSAFLIGANSSTRSVSYTMLFSHSGSASNTNVSSFTALGFSGDTCSPVSRSTCGTFFSARLNGKLNPSGDVLIDSTKSTRMQCSAIDPALNRSSPSLVVCSASSSGRLEYSMTVTLPSTRQKLPSFSLAKLLGSILLDIWASARAWRPMNSGSTMRTMGLSTWV